MAREHHFGDPDRPTWGVADPRPDARQDENAERLRTARLSREIAAEERMSRDHGVVNTRSFAPGPFDPVVSRDATGRLRVDWAKAGEQPRDDHGRFTYPE